MNAIAMLNSRCFKPQGLDFVVMSFVVAPIICLLLSLVFGWVLATVEGWSFSDGFWYVSSNMAGMPIPFVVKAPESMHGLIWDMALSLLAMVLAQRWWD